MSKHKQTEKSVVRKMTSIGMSNRTNPKNKQAKRNFKRYRGQGKP